MLSIGIRFGQGFDKDTLGKLIETGKRPYDFDVLILGSNPGGMVCAKVASSYKKKTALVHWRFPTPTEEEVFDEDRYEAMKALEMDEEQMKQRTRRILAEENKIDILGAVRCLRCDQRKVSQVELRSDMKHSKWCRKVRRSKMDLKNAIQNMAPEAIKYMHDVAMENDLSIARKNIDTPRVSWGKMTERLLDYIICRNWTISTDMLKEKISIFNGHPTFVNSHTVKVVKSNGDVTKLTAEVIISAVDIHNSFPKDVIGAREFGINCDDFFRLSSSPGKTLVVGAGSLGLECAGILSSFNFPVVVVYRNSIFRGDDEIMALIVQDLTLRGVRFLDKRALVSIQKNKTGDMLLAEFVNAHSTTPNIKKKYIEEFDTVLFTTKDKMKLYQPKKSSLQLEIENLSSEQCTPAERTMLEQVISISDQPGNATATALKGKLLGEKLFGHEQTLPEYNLIPQIMLTPLEYAFVGTTETTAKTRLGAECVDVFSGYFQTEEVLPEESSVRDNVCFAKIICMMNRDLIIGLHLLGKDASQLMNKILEPVNGKFRVSDVHPALQNLIEPGDFAE